MVDEGAKPKQNLHLSFSPTFFFSFFLLFLSLVMEAVDSWVIVDFILLVFVLIFHCFSPLPCCFTLCLSIEYLVVKHIRQRDKIRKI